MLVFLGGLIYSPLMYIDYGVAGNVVTITIMTSVKTLCFVDMVTRFFTGYFDEKEFVVSA